MQNNLCSPLLPNGMNGDCLVPLSEIKVPVICDKNVEFDSLSKVLNLVEWKNLVQVDLTAYSPAGITSYEPTTDDPNIVTAEATGKKIVTNTPIPSALVYLDSNACDYSEILNNLKGGIYGIIYVLVGNKIIMDYEDGKYKPILATLNAITKGIPLKETFNNFPLYINHLDYDTFLRAQVISTPFDVSTVLKKAMPAAASLIETVAYNTTSGVVRVMLTERCTTTKITGAVVGDFAILSSNDLDTPAITSVTEVTGMDGYYDIVLNKAAVPVALEAGDYMEIVYKKVATTIVSKISNRLTVWAQ